MPVIRRRGAADRTTVIVIIVVLVVFVLLSCLGLLLAGGLMLPAIGAARQAAQAVRSEAQIKMMLQAIEVYRVDREFQAEADPDAALPPISLDLLVAEGYMTADVLSSPYGPVSDGQGDYWLRADPFEETDDPAGTLVIFDRAMYETNDEMVAVGYQDGSTEQVPAEAVDAMLPP